MYVLDFTQPVGGHSNSVHEDAYGVAWHLNNTWDGEVGISSSNCFRMGPVNPNVIELNLGEATNITGVSLRAKLRMIFIDILVILFSFVNKGISVSKSVVRQVHSTQRTKTTVFEQISYENAN